MTEQLVLYEKFKDMIYHNNQIRMKLHSDIFNSPSLKMRNFFFDIKWIEDLDLRFEIFENPLKIIQTINNIATEFAKLTIDGDYEVKCRFTGLADDLYATKNQRMSWHKTIQEIEPCLENQLVVIRGTIRSKTPIYPCVESAEYVCNICGTTIKITNQDNKINPPKKCFNGSCRSISFSKISERIQATIMMLFQDCQEFTESNELRSIKVFLKDNLATPSEDLKFQRGKRVKLYGIVKTRERQDKDSKGNVIREFYIESNNIEIDEEDFSNIKLTKDDEETLKNIQNPIAFFSDKLFGGISGYDKIKEALILQMVGCPKFHGNNMEKRGNIHIFLIGDAGVSKSQLLKIVSNYSLKSNYASGKGTSSVGITASVQKDAETGQWIAEAGLFPLSHNGILCLDEFTHLSEDDKSAMHEAMEQQQISINKANVHVTMVAETSLLASGNPEKARFDDNQDLFEQFNILPSLANRFDLIFLMRDKPDKAKDIGIANKLFENLKKDENYDKTLFKKYVLYCKLINPKIDEKFQSIFVEHYSRLRGMSSGKTIPISPRQMESTLRLSIAYARANLRDEVIEEDILNAKNLILSYLSEISTDFVTGNIDVSILETGKSQSEMAIAEAILGVMKDKPLMEYSDIFNFFKEKLDEFKFQRILSRMKKEGLIIEPRYSFYKIL